MNYYAYETTGGNVRYLRAFPTELSGTSWIAKNALDWQREFTRYLHSFKLCYNGFKSYDLISIDSAMPTAKLESLSKSEGVHATVPGCSVHRRAIKPEITKTKMTTSQQRTL